MFMGFRHVGREIWYVSETEFAVCGMDEEKKCSLGNHWLSAGDHLTYLGVPISQLC